MMIDTDGNQTRTSWSYVMDGVSSGPISEAHARRVFAVLADDGHENAQLIRTDEVSQRIGDRFENWQTVAETVIATTVLSIDGRKLDPQKVHGMDIETLAHAKVMKLAYIHPDAVNVLTSVFKAAHRAGRLGEADAGMDLMTMFDSRDAEELIERAADGDVNEAVTLLVSYAREGL